MNLVNTSTPNLLPRNIKSLRRKLRFSQEELAQKLGLNRGNIASYENGSAEPKICNLLKFASLFRVSILDLTQKDLSEDTTFLEASENFQEFSSRDLALIDQYAKKAEEIREYIEGLTKCINFKAQCKEELPKLFSEGLGAYMLGLPTCALGFLFFVAIHIVSLVTYRKLS